MTEIIKTVNQEFIENRPLSASSLKAFIKSPKHYIEYLNTPFKKSDAMILGDALDCMLLTPELYKKRFMVYERPNMRTNAGKEEMAEMQAKAFENKMTMVTKDQEETAKICMEAIMDLDQARELIEAKTRVQTKLEWRDKKNNLPLIGYSDFESKAWGTDFVVDLKSTKSADPNDFIRDALKFGYQMQAGGYLDGYHKKYFRFPTFVFLAVETTAPFNVSIMICDDKYVEKAKEEWHGTLKAFRYCLDKQLFDKGYEFRLFGGLDYFNMQIPGYHKPSYPEGWEGEDE